MFSILDLLFPLPLVFVISCAVFNGIAVARDEHHRMTPQSPWFYFRREVRPYSFGAALSFILCLAGPLYAVLAFVYAAPNYDLRSLCWDYATSLSLVIGSASVSAIIIALRAPHFSSVRGLFAVTAITSLLFGICMWMIIFYSTTMAPSFMVVSLEGPSTPIPNSTMYTINFRMMAWANLLIAAMLPIILLLVVLRIRSRPAERWFFGSDNNRV